MMEGGWNSRCRDRGACVAQVPPAKGLLLRPEDRAV